MTLQVDAHIHSLGLAKRLVMFHSGSILVPVCAQDYHPAAQILSVKFLMLLVQQSK
jgi:hypothetical protein